MKGKKNRENSNRITFSKKKPALKMESVCLSETLAFTDEFTRRQNPEEHR